MEFPASRDFERQKPNILRTIGLLVVAGSHNGWVIARIVYGELSLGGNTHTSGLRENPARTEGRERWVGGRRCWVASRRGILWPLSSRGRSVGVPPILRHSPRAKFHVHPAHEGVMARTAMAEGQTPRRAVGPRDVPAMKRVSCESWKS